MNAWLELFAFGMLRTTAVTSLSVLLAVVLLAKLRIRGTKVHRLVWLLVIVQGWLLVPYTFCVEVSKPVPAAPVMRQVSATSAPPTTVVHLATNTVTPAAPTFDGIRLAKRTGLLAWGAGMVVLVGVQLGRYALLVIRAPFGEPTDLPEWNAEWNTARSSTTKRQPVELRITQQFGPLLCYVPFRFLVLVPRMLWEQLTQQDRIAVLRHELAHFERGDLWKNLAVRVLALPQWFNPLVWLAVTRFEEAGEWACDEQASHATGDECTTYASTLLRVADFYAEIPCGSVAATGGELSRRVKRLLTSSNMEDTKMRNSVVPLLLLSIALLQVVRIEQVVADEPAVKANPTADSNAKPEDTASAGKSKQWNFDQPYVVEPPDILLISGCELKAKPGYMVKPFDSLLIRTNSGSVADAYTVSPEGEIDLGPGYERRYRVGGLPMEVATNRIEHAIHKKSPLEKVSVSLASMGRQEQILGEHLVGPDGRINLGDSGSLYVAGMTIEQTRDAIKKLVSRSPQVTCSEVSVSIFAYNSKKYYVITKGGDAGDNIVVMPVTGNERVLDAIAAIGGLDNPASAAKLWIARPAANGVGKEQILPVNYDEIVVGKSATNHQLYPSDRLFIQRVGEKPTAANPVTAAPPEEVPVGAYNQPIDEKQSNKTSADTKQKIKLRVQLVSDSKKSLQHLDGMTFGDSQLLLEFLRVLSKNSLVNCTAVAAITANDGEPIAVEMAGAASNNAERPASLGQENGIRVELVSQIDSDHPRIEVRTTMMHNKRTRQHDIAFAIEEFQSCLIRLPKDKHDQEAPETYVVVTREAVE